MNHTFIIIKFTIFLSLLLLMCYTLILKAELIKTESNLALTKQTLSICESGRIELQEHINYQNSKISEYKTNMQEAEAVYYKKIQEIKSSSESTLSKSRKLTDNDTKSKLKFIHDELIIFLDEGRK